MKKLNEIIQNNSSPVEFQLFDGSFTVSAERNVYTSLRKKYVEIADEAYSQYLEVENNYKKLDNLVETADSFFEESIKKAILEVVNDAMSVGILTLDTNTVYREYYENGYVNKFKNAYKAFSDPYYEAKAELEALKSQRKSVDNALSGYSDDYFNIGGRMESALMNAGDKSDMKKAFRALFENTGMRNDLKDGFWLGILNLHCYIVNAFPKKGNISFGGWTTTDSCNKASAALNNMKNSSLSAEQNKQFVQLILENNPYLDSAYPAFADRFPEYSKQFVILADYFGAPSIIKKVNDELISYVNENIGQTEADVDYCKSLLNQKLSEVGLSFEAAAPVYAVIQARSDQLDLEYRTVEGAVFNTRDEADAARASIAANESILKKDCSEFIMRSEYVDHIEAIRTLSIPQSLTVLYVMQYEQKLSEFDKKCKVALLYDQSINGEKKSLLNRISSITTSAETQKAAWEEITRNGQYSLSEIMAGKPEEKGLAGTAGNIGNAAADKAKAAAGKLKGLFGKK